MKMKNLKVALKLVGGFVIVAFIVLVVGYFGLNGATRLGGAITQIADVNLPSIQSILIISEAQTAVDAAENALLASNQDAAGRKAAYERFDAAYKRAADARKIYEPLPQSKEEAAVWAKFVPAWDAWIKDHDTFVTLAREYEKALASGAEDTSQEYEAMSIQALVTNGISFTAAETLLNQLVETNNVAAAEAEASAVAAVGQVTTIALIGMIAGFIFALLLGIVLAMGITRPLSKGVSFAQLVTAGDFTQQLDIHQKDEVGVLADALNAMAKKLRDMVASVQENAEQVASSSEEISASAQKLAEGAQSQASTLEETSASVEELTASVDQVAEHAQSQASAVEQGTASMAQVQTSIKEVSGNLKEISDMAKASVDGAVDGAKAVQQVVDGINLIAAGSEKIGGIVNVISDIADQTNLLALNASIEAARAGEHGRGFAVVADEVSKLADRSAASTKEIESLIKESVKNVAEGVKMAMSAQAVIEKIRIGATKTNETIGSLSESMSQQVAAVQQLSTALTNVSEMSQSISAATAEQTTNAKQVSKAVENVNNITQSAASAAEETSAATEQLSTMAQELQRLMSQFKIGDGNGKAGRQQKLVAIGAGAKA